MYFGEYERTVDYKGRLTVPAHLLAPLPDRDWSKVMVIKGEPSCLYVYDLATWGAVLDEAYRSMDDDESRLFMHRALADAALSDVDNLKRITIPAPLLGHAEIDKQSVVAATTEVDGPGLEPNSVNFSMRRVAEGGSSKMRF